MESYTNHQAQQQRRDRNDATSPHTDQTENLQSIEIMVTLQPFHFSNGQLNLRCSAQILGIYSAISEVQLGAGLREPVPERDMCHFNPLTAAESCCFGIDNQLCGGKPELFGIGNQLCSGEPRYLT
ncbi:hypothetical protein K0M31_007340 [Melipona bicolor]|uniref:Uncharacterized protein n=1 Tax=Melipona bicolor TaxID=60889 RepID=A0AA40GB81_9HYME|nr:hypothetical protein K0M31_007340 [Melipona bicolor]